MDRLHAQADERVSPLVRANALAYAAFLAGFRGNSEVKLSMGMKPRSLLKQREKKAVQPLNGRCLPKPMAQGQQVTIKPSMTLCSG